MIKYPFVVALVIAGLWLIIEHTQGGLLLGACLTLFVFLEVLGVTKTSK